MRMMPKHRIHA